MPLPDAAEIVNEAVRCNPNCATALEHLATRLLDSVAQRAVGTEPLGDSKAQTRGTARIKVCICRKGTRLLDIDNLAGGTKALLDALRYEGVIQDDDPGSIDFEVRQEKVKRADIGTEVTITIL